MDGRQNIRRLKQIMKIQGCQRLMRDSHVPVIVPRAHWQDRVRLHSGSGAIPSLEMGLDYRLYAYDHENLITAAKHVLDHDNQWWIVDVYLTDNEGAFYQSQLSDIPVHKILASPGGNGSEVESFRDKFIQSLKERYPNDNRPPDGLIYERINRYEGYLDTPRDSLAANNWWAVLEVLAGSKKGKYLKQFLKYETLHQKLNSLLVIPGLWEGMRIGLLHKVTAMHCDEVSNSKPQSLVDLSQLTGLQFQPIGCYWDLIFRTFLRLVGGRDELLPLIDGITVDLIQSRVPKVSGEDLNSLQVELDEGRLFSNFSEPVRQEIWTRLREVDYPIPTLKTFFKDRLYLEVAQSVMKRLFVRPRKEKMTIDQGVCGKYDTSIPLSMALRQQWLGDDLLEFWRFSFQYGFEMTDHQRLKGPKDAGPEGLLDRQSSEPTFLPKQELWRQFFTLMRARSFRAPVLDNTSVAMGELPSPRPCEYPEDVAEEIEVAKRCGKPYSNTVEADRFALSAESLHQSQTPIRVTAGFVRQAVFKAFFGYLRNSNGPTPARPPPEDHSGNRGEEATGANSGGNGMVTDSMDLDPGNLMPSPLAIPIVPTSTAVVAAPAPDPPLRYTMNITLGETTRTLILPLDRSFMEEFSAGLSAHYFAVWLEENGRSISPDKCYLHYLNYPASQLHAELREDGASNYDSASSEMGPGSKRRRVDGDQDLADLLIGAEQWLQEQLSRLANRDEEEL